MAANPAVEPDPFNNATTEFVRLDDLVGRAILVIPKELTERVSTLPGSNGKTYESVTADVIVLDGPITEKIPSIPSTHESVFFSGQVVVGQLKPKVATNGMVLGRMAQQPSKTKGFGDAWVLQPPVDADKVLARPAARAYLDASDPFSG